MTGITLSAGVRANLLQLQRTAELTQVTQQRLSTGRDVNSALDNPTNFFTSQSLNNRAGDLASLLDSMGGAINTVTAADQALGAITRLVESAAATVRQALSEGANSRFEVTSDGALADATQAALTDKSARDKALDSLAVDVGGGAAGQGITGDVVIERTDAVSGVVETFTFTTAGTTTVREVVEAINGSGFAEADVNASGELMISTEEDGVEVNLTYNAAATQLATLDATAANTGGTDISIAGNQTDTISVERANQLKAQFDELRGQIDKLVDDAGFNGTNLLSGDDLTVVFNEEVGARQSSLEIEGVTFDASTLGVPEVDDFALAGALETAITGLDEVVDTLRNQQQSFGSNLSIVQVRSDFTQELVNTLRKGADELVLADTNEEGANLLALQTRQQLSSTALGLANQADQSVLRLF